MKTTLEMFNDIEEFEMPDGPNITVKDVVPYFCEKVENNLKAIQIVVEKGLPLVEIDMIKQSENYEQYQIKISWWNYKPFAIPKTEEEFNLLKRYCDEQSMEKSKRKTK